MARGFLIAMTAFSLTAPLRGDGGTLRVFEKRDGLTIAIFTAPTPPFAGLIDISVLVQNEKTGDASLDGEVIVTARQADVTTTKRATNEEATNKLLRAAQVDFPMPGTWTINVDVIGTGGLRSVSFELRVEPAPPRWREMLPWIAWPFAAIAIYVAYFFRSKSLDMRG